MQNHTFHHDRYPGAGRGKRRNVFIAFAALALALAGVVSASCTSSQTSARPSAPSAHDAASARDAGDGVDSAGEGVRVSVGAGMRVRIGTYDSRAVTVAYVRSDAFDEYIRKIKTMHDEAKERGDTQHAQMLNELGESQQIRRNIQGFSTASVEDILNTVRDQLPAVAQRMNVSVIAREADYHDAPVEVIDITDELVKLFDPDAKTLSSIAYLRDQPPVPIEVIARKPTGD